MMCMILLRTSRTTLALPRVVYVRMYVIIIECVCVCARTCGSDLADISVEECVGAPSVSVCVYVEVCDALEPVFRHGLFVRTHVLVAHGF